MDLDGKHPAWTVVAVPCKTAHPRTAAAIHAQVSPSEAAAVCASITEMITGRPPDQRRPWFPGSQPVSLDRSNLELLRERRCGCLEMKAGTETPQYLLDLLAWIYLLQSSLLAAPTPSHPFYYYPLQVLGHVEGGRHALHACHHALRNLPRGPQAGHAARPDALADRGGSRKAAKVPGRAPALAGAGSRGMDSLYPRRECPLLYRTTPISV